MQAMLFEELEETFAALGRRAFLETYPAPALIIGDSFRPGGDILGADTPAGDTPVETVDPLLWTEVAPRGEKGPVLGHQGQNEVMWVVKSDRNPFEALITLGRASNNDLVFPLPTVSKCHAVFSRREEAWFVTDRNSTNGTWLGRTPLVPERATELRDADTLRFGPDLFVRFFTAVGLVAYVTAPHR